jgi:NACalpha-BTF3-like transcription factor
MTAQLSNLNKISENKKDLPVITIKEHDIELLKKELDITYEEAKLQLIKAQGDVKKVIENFLNNFNF